MSSMNTMPIPELVEKMRERGTRDIALQLFVSVLANRLEEQYKRAEALSVEVDVLRRYGNKICTSMADEELERIKHEKGETNENRSR